MQGIEFILLIYITWIFITILLCRFLRMKLELNCHKKVEIVNPKHCYSISNKFIKYEQISMILWVDSAIATLWAAETDTKNDASIFVLIIEVFLGAVEAVNQIYAVVDILLENFDVVLHANIGLLKLIAICITGDTI